MKKILIILLAASFSSSAIALAMPKKPPRAYEVRCVVKDNRDGDQKISDHTFIFHRNRSSRPAWIENIKVKSTEHELRFLVGYDDEEDLIWIGLDDITAEFSTSSYDQDPRKLNVFFTSQEFGITATCTFKPIKIKKQKLQDDNKLEVE